MMSTAIKQTITRTLPSGELLEITTLERDGSDGLSPGFSTTALLWEPRGRISANARRNNGSEPDALGCLHDEILQAAPELTPLIEMHLCDPDGVPMYAKANGWYFYSGKAAVYERQQVARGHDYGYSRMLETSDHDRAAAALRIDPADLPEGLDQEGFNAFVDSLAQLYRSRAALAREMLHTLPEVLQPCG